MFIEHIQNSHLFYNCRNIFTSLFVALLFLVLHLTFSFTHSLTLRIPSSFYSPHVLLFHCIIFTDIGRSLLSWNFPSGVPRSSTAGWKEEERSVFVCDGISVCVLDSSKCHGISHGNASQHLMSASLFLQLSGQRSERFHTET